MIILTSRIVIRNCHKLNTDILGKFLNFCSKHSCVISLCIALVSRFTNEGVILRAAPDGFKALHVFESNGITHSLRLFPVLIYELV